MGTAKAYWFRVFSHSATAYSISEKFKYDLPENVKRRAVTAGIQSSTKCSKILGL
jgi:hypothetical protein